MATAAKTARTKPAAKRRTPRPVQDAPAEGSAAAAPALNLNFLSHGTLETRDSEFAERFYREFLGLDVVRLSKVALVVRLGGKNAIAVLKTRKRTQMSLGNHNGLDVATPEEVDRSYETVMAQKAKWGLHKISKPTKLHGNYGFFFWDADDNCWEILTNPKDGYSSLFERGRSAG